MITVRGSVPYPPQADARPIQRLAADLSRLAQGLQQGSQQLTGAARTAQSTWQGAASQAFGAHVDERARTVAAVGGAVAGAAPILNTYAAAITATSAAYSTAATAEQVARAGLPWTAAALAAALAAETAATAALQAAGVACAGALVAVELQIAAAQFLGVDRSTFQGYRDAATQIWEGISEAVSEGDVDAAIKVLNTTITIPDGNGGQTRTSVLGWLLRQDRRVSLGLDVIQGIYGAAVLLTEPPLRAVERPDLVGTLTAAGYDPHATSAAAHGRNMALLEDLRRREGTEVDQSASVFHTEGVARDGSRVINLTVPGIVPPDEGLNGASGSRNLINAAASQVTGFGQEEVAIRDWVLAQGLRPGDTVNFYAHSQGGIVSRNVANDLATRGIRVNVVAYGVPDGQLRQGIGAYTVQNMRDPVPAARIGGDGGVSTTLHPGQHNIRFDHEVDGGLFAHHDAQVYGRWLDSNPNAAGVPSLRTFLDSQRDVVLDPTRSGVLTLEGPRTPQGQPVEVVPPQPYELGRRP